MTTKVLPYDRSIVGQERYYDCGPASVQNVLSSRMYVSETQLISEIGTTENGTDYVGLCQKALAIHLPNVPWQSVYLTNDPPTEAQKSLLWWNLVRSIDNGYGVVVNIDAPPDNYPIGVNGSASPGYGGGEVFHYVAAMGWTDEGTQAIWIADSGFEPFGYWVSFAQLAELIVPKGYCFAALPLISPPPPGVNLPPGIPVAAGSVPPPPIPPPAPPVVVPPTPIGSLMDPTTKVLLTQNPNAYRPRGLATPMWIACHTSESLATATDLRNYCEDNQVSYNKIVDDHDIVTMVADADAPWSAVNANRYAYHVCASSSYAGWSRDQWLDPSAANDGRDEDAQLTNMAKVVAFWCRSNPARQIPAVWIGGGPVPPWGLNGICGHVDFGAWGGGHFDPGPNFPVNEFMARVSALITGAPKLILAPLPPVGLVGTKPDKYADVLLYKDKPKKAEPEVNLVAAVQHKLVKGSTAIAGHVDIDGVFGDQTREAVRAFQKTLGLVGDGIVGPFTAAALKL